MSEHKHIHTHHDGDSCSCGHDHHGGQEDHSGHRHDENGNCILEDAPGAVHTEYHLHDEARVISGRLTIAGRYGEVRKVLESRLEQTAKAVQAMGGIVGHIKASCEVKTVEMFSVTDTDTAVKAAPEQEIKINLAAIVFLIDPEEAEVLVRQTLEAVRDSAAR